MRGELDAWELRTGRGVRLAGFSTHYNLSIDVPPTRRLGRLARLLTYILPVPVMLLSANRESTGIGVRPRAARIEVTGDFTPEPGLQIATATLIAGIVQEVARWPSWSVAEFARRELPVIAGFAPMPHTSRKGWLARFDCYPRNPFESPDTAAWFTSGHDGPRTLRDIAQAVFHYFRRAIARVADPFTLRLIAAVTEKRAASLLDFADRPAAYQDVGRLCRWRSAFPRRALRRSRYEL
ncbi:MAG: hypothetical protein LC753_03555 [Acidobacteria bacterium]|nr:hypothetical protein [Acidobacteriota bacterium]